MPTRFHRATCCVAVLAFALAEPNPSPGVAVAGETARSGDTIGADRASTAERAELARVERSAWVMGTRLRIVVEAAHFHTATRASEAALREVERIERVLGTWDLGTEMAAVNGAPVGAPVVVSLELAGLLVEAAAWADRTRRAFDPTVGALVDAWDLRGTGRIPSPAELDVALRRTGPATFALDAGAPSVRRFVEGAWIDTGGFGKGAALRAAACVLARHDVERALVDLGGQLWAWSADGREPWSVGVAHPERRDEPMLDLSIAGVSAATSGTSERWLDVDGRRIGHILDPRTGRPVAGWGSVTVVSADPVEADILATALYVMGPDVGMAWAAEHSGAGVLFARAGVQGPALRWNPAMERWLHAAPFAPTPGAATAAPPPRKEAHR